MLSIFVPLSLALADLWLQTGYVGLALRRYPFSEGRLVDPTIDLSKDPRLSWGATVCVKVNLDVRILGRSWNVPFMQLILNSPLTADFPPIIIVLCITGHSIWPRQAVVLLDACYWLVHIQIPTSAAMRTPLSSCASACNACMRESIAA